MDISTSVSRLVVRYTHEWRQSCAVIVDT